LSTQTDDAMTGWLRLTRFLIFKSIVEVLFVAALAVGFYLTAFSPSLRGEVDEANAQRVSGWAVNQATPDAHVEVQLYIDDRFAASTSADLSRPDVMAAGFALDEQHGFKFETPTLPHGEHEARVYAAHESGAGLRRTLQLVGKPVRFHVD
jgi:hypothetical protein